MSAFWPRATTSDKTTKDYGSVAQTVATLVKGKLRLEEVETDL